MSCGLCVCVCVCNVLFRICKLSDALESFRFAMLQQMSWDAQRWGEASALLLRDVGDAMRGEGPDWVAPRRPCRFSRHQTMRAVNTSCLSHWRRRERSECEWLTRGDGTRLQVRVRMQNQRLNRRRVESKRVESNREVCRPSGSCHVGRLPACGDGLTLELQHCYGFSCIYCISNVLVLCC